MKLARWATGLAVGRVNIGDAERVSAAPGLVVVGIGPELAGPGAPASGIEHRRGRLVGEQLGRFLELGEQTLVHRPQQEGGAADPVGQGRAIQSQSLAGLNLSLPIQRQVIGVFGDEHLRRRRLGRQIVDIDHHLNARQMRRQ